ncbi:MAG: hypothetical protein AB1414_04880 [bacterium]
MCPLRYYFVPFVVYPFLTAKNAKKSTAKNAKIKGKRNHRKFTKLQFTMKPFNQLPITSYQLPVTNYQLPITSYQQDIPV